MIEIDYTVATAFSAGLAGPKFHAECAADATITAKFLGLNNTLHPVVSVVFTEALTGPEQTALDDLVTAHDGIAIMGTFKDVTPASISTALNNYDAGHLDNDTVLQGATGTPSITGFLHPTTDAHRSEFKFVNTSAVPIKLKHMNGGSDANKQIECPNDADYDVAPGVTVTVRRIRTGTKWRIVGTAVTVAGAGGLTQNIQTFTANGNWTEPAGTITEEVIEGIGGGGSGGGGIISATNASGGGGGASGVRRRLVLPGAKLTDNAAIVIGTGGVSRGAGTNGDEGTDTTVADVGFVAQRGEHGVSSTAQASTLGTLIPTLRFSLSLGELEEFLDLMRVASTGGRGADQDGTPAATAGQSYLGLPGGAGGASGSTGGDEGGGGGGGGGVDAAGVKAGDGTAGDGGSGATGGIGGSGYGSGGGGGAGRDTDISTTGSASGAGKDGWVRITTTIAA